MILYLGGCYMYLRNDKGLEDSLVLSSLELALVHPPKILKYP